MNPYAILFRGKLSFLVTYTYTVTQYVFADEREKFFYTRIELLKNIYQIGRFGFGKKKKKILTTCDNVKRVGMFIVYIHISVYYISVKERKKILI